MALDRQMLLLGWDVYLGGELSQCNICPFSISLPDHLFQGVQGIICLCFTLTACEAGVVKLRENNWLKVVTVSSMASRVLTLTFLTQA